MSNEAIADALAELHAAMWRGIAVSNALPIDEPMLDAPRFALLDQIGAIGNLFVAIRGASTSEHAHDGSAT